MTIARRIALVALTATGALALIWLTNRGAIDRMWSGTVIPASNSGVPASGTGEATIGGAAADDADAEPDEEEAAAVAHSPPDPGQRREIAQLHQQVAEYGESQWLKSFTLVNSDGEELSSEELKGQPYIACFFFSTCPGSCKQQTDQMRLLQRRYRDQPVRLVSISVDPELDTPEVLAAYADAAGAIEDKWLFLTGDMKQISRVGNEVFFLGAIQWRGHPDRFCLVDSTGKLVGKYNWHDPEELRQLHEHVDELLASND